MNIDYNIGYDQSSLPSYLLIIYSDITLSLSFMTMLPNFSYSGDFFFISRTEGDLMIIYYAIYSSSIVFKRT